VHVIADDAPGPGFERVQGTLEDVYFATLTAQRRQATASPIAA
jgi:ABC-2 type transport system ATP-binding protein